MPTFFTKRQLRLMGEPEPEPPAPAYSLAGPRCCEKATATRCGCDAIGWFCPEHKYRGQPCIPHYNHD